MLRPAPLENNSHADAAIMPYPDSPYCAYQTQMSAVVNRAGQRPSAIRPLR
jgi:hypothetical protein